MALEAVLPSDIRRQIAEFREVSWLPFRFAPIALNHARSKRMLGQALSPNVIDLSNCTVSEPRFDRQRLKLRWERKRS